MTGGRGQDKYLLMYSEGYRNYSSDSADNYNDHFSRFSGAQRYGLKHDLTLNLEGSPERESRGRDVAEGFLPSQSEQYGIKSPLTTNFINDELRRGYDALDGRGKAGLTLLYKKLTFGSTPGVRDGSEDSYNYIQEQEWHEDNLIVEVFDQYSSRTCFRYSSITSQRRCDNNSKKGTNEYCLLYGLKS